MYKYKYYFVFIVLIVVLLYLLLNSGKNYENFQNKNNKYLKNDKLNSIHQKLKLKYGNFKSEYPEQVMIEKHILPDSQILELGPNIGRSSLIANFKLRNKKKHLCVETNSDSVKKLKENRDLNNMEFQIFNGAISRKPLYQKGWRCYDYPIKNSKKVNTKIMDEVKKKYNIDFDTIIADCEGCLISILKDEPNFLQQINLIILEHDFNNKEELEYFNELIKNNNFNLVDKILKKDVGLLKWKDGILSDPIFVSVWKK